MSKEHHSKYTSWTDIWQREKSKELPLTKFGWIGVWKGIPDEFVLNHQSLDGYLYLRFLKMLTVICLAGACITFPILFPVNATGGGGQKQFDLLSFSNIGANSKNRYYAHVFLGWIFFSKFFGFCDALCPDIARFCHVHHNQRDYLLHQPPTCLSSSPFQCC